MIALVLGILVLGVIAVALYFLRSFSRQKKYASLLEQKISIYKNQKQFVERIKIKNTNENKTGELNDLLKSLYDFLNSNHGPFSRMTLISVENDIKKGNIISVFTKHGTETPEGTELNIEKFNSYPALLKNENFVINDIETVTHRSETDQLLFREGIRSYLCKPLFQKEKIIGVLNLSSEKKHHFTDQIISSIDEVFEPIIVSFGQAFEFISLENQLEKLDRKNKKTWQMSIAVHQQKEETEEKMKLIEVEKEKLEKEREKIKKRNEKLWETSVAIHNEKEKIEKLKAEIEEKHKSVTDSISYAQRIQEALLPSLEVFKQTFRDAFIFFNPKDVVSGDFYWSYKTEDGKIIWTAVDCTGHGVPGAFMSMIGISLLNKIVIENKETSPEKILDQLRNGIISALSQKGNSGSRQKDGMDLTLCIFDRKAMTIEFSGANNPLWLVRNDEIKEYKVQKQPVGYHEVQEGFAKQMIDVLEGDFIYTFSDGFADQFGGEKGKKYKSKHLKSFLLSVNSNPGITQHALLEKEFDSWKNGLEQVDDVCIIGVKI